MAPNLLLILLAPSSVALAAALSAKGPRWAAWLSAALAGAAGLLGQGAPTSSVWGGGFFEVGARADLLSLAILGLVSVVGASCLQFAERYLQGDPKRDRFLRRMGFTLAAVQTFALSPSMFQLWLAAIAVSVGLHGLLLHFPDRPGARQAAWTKFLVSRTGDLAIGSAVFWTWSIADTTTLDALPQAFASHPGSLTGVTLLLALGALCKSAQLPFHTWLPETLETPTPVSAFMHAGVVNAGGLIVLRLHPLFEASPAASSVLALMGALTAVYGALVMLAQTSIKRALAYSTIAQMGFMIFQCGVGAYGLALLHILAHSLYKSRAFLRSGSTVTLPPRRAVVLPWPSLVFGLVFAAALGASIPWTFPEATHSLSEALFAAIVLGACAYAVTRFHATGGVGRSAMQGFALAVASFALAAALHAVFPKLVAAGDPAIPIYVLTPAILLFVGLLVFQFALARIHLNPAMRILYVHASHGFYLGPWVNRQIRRFAPIPTAP